MNFQELVKIEDADFYLDVAFRKATKKLDLNRDRIKANRFEKSKKLELLRIGVTRDSLVNSFTKILVSFPSIDSLPIFYNELVKVTLDYYALKKSLGAVNWCVGKINRFFSIYNDKIRKTKDSKKINQYRREFNGRVSSLLRQIKDNLVYLEECRRIMKQYPTIKTSMFTAVVVGFPNVGKTTLLYKLTGSKPAINSYPFTTISINIAYIDKKIQLIDVPGTLNRFDKMNNIEKQAYLALKYCGDIVIYVVDLTESYPLKDQLKLLTAVKKYDKKVIIYLSKKDLVNAKDIAKFSKKYNAVSDIEELKSTLLNSKDIKK